MSKIKIIADSTCDLSKELVEKYDVTVIPLCVVMGENSYYEKVLGSLMYYRECDFRIVEVPEDLWCEIDDADVLKRARDRFGK